MSIDHTVFILYRTHNANATIKVDLQTLRIRRDPHENENFIILRMFIRSCEEASLHKHLKKKEYSVILRGKGELVRGNSIIPVREGELIYIKVRCTSGLWMRI